jgi:cytochrome c-type biogenesis protein CcmH/NrfF
MESTQAIPVSINLEQLIWDGKTDSEIRTILTQQYGEQYLVENLMPQVKQLRRNRTAAIGLITVLIGIGVLIMSFVLSVMHYQSGNSLGTILYGLTTTGLLVISWGLFKVFG